MEPPGAPGEATMAMPRVMMNGITVPMEMGSWFIRQTAVAQAVMVIIEPAMWDVRAQRNRKVADFRGNAVCLRALQVDPEW